MGEAKKPLIVLLTMGTLGDVHPVVALGLGLKAAGYRVRIAAPRNFEALAEDNGLDFVEIGDDFRELMAQPIVQEIIQRGVLANAVGSVRFARAWHERTSRKAMAATEGADLLLFHPKVNFASSIAEARKIPCAMFASQPLSRTGEFPVMSMLPPRFRSGLTNRASYTLLRAQGLVLGGLQNRLRRELLSLPKAGKRLTRAGEAPDGTPLPILYGFSEHVQPKPADWPADAHVTGYWELEGEYERDWQPDAALKAFLEAGMPPVYIGFGSMPLPDPAAAFRLWVEAVGAAGLRGVVASGWGGLGEVNKNLALPDYIHVLDEAPHSRLFPLMRAVVHHGGAGTTAAGLRAGRPTMVCPFIADQRHWGERVVALGAGLMGPAPKKWRIDRLAGALRTLVDNEGFATAAERVGGHLREENGVANAVAVVEQILAAGKIDDDVAIVGRAAGSEKKTPISSSNAG